MLQKEELVTWNEIVIKIRSLMPMAFGTELRYVFIYLGMILVVVLHNMISMVTKAILSVLLQQWMMHLTYTASLMTETD